MLKDNPTLSAVASYLVALPCADCQERSPVVTCWCQRDFCSICVLNHLPQCRVALQAHQREAP